MKRLLLSVAALGCIMSVSAQNYWTPSGTHIYANNSGNVGIGTATPTDGRLHILTNSDADRALRIEKGILSMTSATEVQIDAANVVAGRFVLRSSGNIGVGVVNPNAKLHLTTTSDLTNAIRVDLGRFSMGSGGEFQIDAPNVAAGRFVVKSNGNVGIGTADPKSFKLAVEGKVGAREVIVTTDAWADYVFFKNYRLRPLFEVEKFIRNNGHLPEVPSAAEVMKNGVNLGEMDATLLKKIEELTLYVIEQNKQLAEQNQQLAEQHKKIEALEQKLAQPKR